MPSLDTPTLVDPLEPGRRALREGRWEDARALLNEERQRSGESAELLELLGYAGWWLNDARLAIESRERAFLLFRSSGNEPRAALQAALVAADHVEFNGDEALAIGWLGRARTTLDGYGSCPERALISSLEAYVALTEKNIEEARGHADTALAVARETGCIDAEMMALAVHGLAHVYEGNVERGMRLLDEATLIATDGEAGDQNMIATTCCFLIKACERTRDYDRAAQWCGRVQEYCRRWRFDSMFAVCRTQYATVLMWQGRWAEAEQELLTAQEELEATRPGTVRSSILRLAELRLRQGRLDEARALYDQAPTSILALLGRSMLALAEGNTTDAIDAAERYLRRIPRADRTERTPGLEQLARAQITAGLLDNARTTIKELREIDEVVGIPAVAVARITAEGMLAAAEGRHDEARRLFEDAIDTSTAAEIPVEAASTRVLLASSLAALGRTTAATEELQRAIETFTTVGAERARGEAESLLSSLLSPTAPPIQATSDLTSREIDVLRLIAGGTNNDSIAEQLFLSVRTVERHISNIYSKLGLEGRSARSAATAWAIRHHIV